MLIQIRNNAIGYNPGYGPGGCNPGWGGMGNTVKLNCKFCNGTGRNFTSVCPGCTGYGEVMVVNPPQDCRRCRGTGREFTDPCSICGGCGYMFRQQQQGNMMGGFGGSSQV